MTASGGTNMVRSGQMFGRYQIVRSIGTGGMADVYEAVHLGLKKTVALKLLRREFHHEPMIRARFMREGEAATRIGHPNVVDITDVGTIDDIPYLVMEYLEGETLGQRIAREGRLEVQHAVHLMLPVVSAVAAAHGKGVIHRDLKPDNIFLVRDGKRRTLTKVLDFGVSRLVDSITECVTKNRGIVGTPHYVSPEQVRSERVIDGRTDQYAIGVMLYEMTTGRRPWEGRTLVHLLNAVVNDDLVSPRTHQPDLPADFEAVILRAMQRDPAGRFPDLHELGAALLPFASRRAREFWNETFTDEEAVTQVRRASDRPLAIRMGAVDEGIETLVDAERVAVAPKEPRRATWLPRLAVVALISLVGGVAWAALRHRTDDAAGPPPTGSSAPQADIVAPPPAQPEESSAEAAAPILTTSTMMEEEPPQAQPDAGSPRPAAVAESAAEAAERAKSRRIRRLRRLRRARMDRSTGAASPPAMDDPSPPPVEIERNPYL